MKKPLILVGDSIGRSYYPRPSHQENFPLDDERHWYDRENMHWQVQKLPMPESTMDGPEGKRVLCNIPMVHDYMNQFRYGLERVADSSGIELEVIETGLNSEDQVLYAGRVVESAPDLAIHLMPAGDQREGLYKNIYAAGIPIICSNLLPSRKDLPYILSWTGPNDWEMSRELARHFALNMDYKGGYALISHFKGTSCDTARTWGVITELKKIAPDMVCLDHCSTQMDLYRSQEAVETWIREYGPDLKGIVSADSALVQQGIFRALRKYDREDVICVSHWSPPEALESIKKGALRATTYQSGIIDGTLAMQTAVDWFNGFEVPPVCYMPVHVITASDVELFLNKRNEFPHIEYKEYMISLRLGNRQGIEKYFLDLVREFQECSLITAEYCSGVAIELLSRFIAVSAEAGISNRSLTGHDPALLTKQILQRKNFNRTLEWLERISLKYCDLVNQELPGRVSADQVVEYVHSNSHRALSLKTLSYHFNLSAAYLGQLYKKSTGSNFSTHLNVLRIEQAKVLLRNPHLKEYEVAREVGYTDPSYFFRIFKKITGMNPSAFREQAEEEAGRD